MGPHGTSAAAYVIRPRFGSLAHSFFRLLFFTFGGAWLVGVIAIFFGRHPEGTLEFMGWGGLAVVAASAVLGLVLAVLTIPWQVTLTSEGIVGRSYIGFRRRIAYRDLDTPYIDNSQGFTLLRMSDRVTGKELVMYPTGLDLQAVHKQLTQLAGPDNPLTRAFAPG